MTAHSLIALATLVAVMLFVTRRQYINLRSIVNNFHFCKLFVQMKVFNYNYENLKQFRIFLLKEIFFILSLCGIPHSLHMPGCPPIFIHSY